MLNRLACRIIALVACSAAVACGGTGHSVVMHDTMNSTWSTTEEFIYDNSDTLSRRDIAIVIRYGDGIVKDSVRLNIMTISPDSMVVVEPFTLHIPQLGDMRPKQHTFDYRNNVVFSREGEYLFRLQPIVEAEGISSVGIVITEPGTDK